MINIKRTVTIFISLAMMIMMSAASVLAATKDDLDRPLRIQNEGFETPSITTEHYQQPSMDKVPYWRTTAYEGKIEFFKKNTGTYITNTLLVPRAGLQSAELNADEPSTLYQYVYGDPGTVYEWGVSHRARYVDPKKKEVLAVFIGPRQPKEPSKTSKTGMDQFMKTVAWLDKKNINGLNTANMGYGDCIAFEVFSTKFGVSGTFVDADGNTVSDDDALSMTQDDDHTEKWHIWIMASNNDAWYDYGVTAAEDCAYYNDGFDSEASHTVENPEYAGNEFEIRYKNPDYNYKYTVPQTSEKGTIYAYCSYSNVNGATYGNFVDNSRMGRLSPVRVTTNEGGSADAAISTNVSTSDTQATVTAEQQFSIDTAAGNTLSLTIKPGAADEGSYTFVGAYINNEWKYSTDSIFTPNDDGTYSLSHTVADGMNSIHIVFAKHPYIIHSPNGGIYNGTANDTADKITATGTINYSGAPTADGNARFTYWEVAGEGVSVGENHTVEIAEGTTLGKYNITIKDNGSDVKTIYDTDIVVFIAHYEYPQRINIYTMEGGRWVSSDSGGTVSIKYNDQTVSNSGASTTIYAEDNTTITITAAAKSEYIIDRIVSDDTVTTEGAFTFYSAGERIVYVYFMPDKVKPIVSYVDETNTNGTDSYVFDTNTNETINIPDVGGVYGNTISTAFTSFWSGDENTYRYVQWVIDLPFDTETLLKKNAIINDFKDVNVETDPFKTDTEGVSSKFKGEIYRCKDGNTGKRLIVNFPTVITGATSIYSTIILDGIYSPNSTARLHSITEINANDENDNLLNNTNSFSVGISSDADKDKYDTDSNNYYITEVD